MIVLDTHVLIWFVQGNDRLGPIAVQLVRDAAPKEAAIVSTITFWEIAMLSRRGRLGLRQSAEDWLDEFCVRSNSLVSEVSREIAITAGGLSEDIHGDPADRIIIATAIHHGCPVLTADRAILGYAALGHVRAIDASL